MNIEFLLEQLRQEALKNKTLRKQLLETKLHKNSVTEFCKICQNYNYPIYPMELVMSGEEIYDTMKRSTNGGGANSPILEGQDDIYELFLASLEM